MALVGQTGSGKTFLAERFVAPLHRVIVLDPKGMLRKKWNLAEWGPEQRDRLRSGAFVRARIPMPLDGDWESALWDVYEAGGVTLYIDEVYGVTNGSSRPSPALLALYTRGRERNIGVWGAMQRPAMIPSICLSECSWFFAFRLLKKEDRERMSDYMGDYALIDPKDRYGFWTYNTHWRNAQYLPKVSSNTVRAVVEPPPPRLFSLTRGR